MEGVARDPVRFEQVQPFSAGPTARATPVLEGTIAISVTVLIEYEIS